MSDDSLALEAAKNIVDPSEFSDADAYETALQLMAKQLKFAYAKEKFAERQRGEKKGRALLRLRLEMEREADRLALDGRGTHITDEEVLKRYEKEEEEARDMASMYH